jgi:hypothetical protein
MSLKRIVYRGGGYARRRDRSRYAGTPGLTLEEEARVNKEMAGCFRGCFGGCMVVCFLFILLGLGARLIQAYSEGLPIPFGDQLLAILGGVFAVLLLLCFVAYYRAKHRRLQSHVLQPISQQPENPQSVPSGKGDYLKCPCRHCKQSLEFPGHGVGTTIECPTCGLSTDLYDANTPP